MLWIYLSPHFDDAALSCGGLIWQQTQAGDSAAIWTICAGQQPRGPYSPFAQALHARWETGPAATLQRAGEDIASCRRLGAAYRHFSIPDCIYRRGAGETDFLYASEGSLSGPLHPADAGLVHALSQELRQALPPVAQVICPLSLGNHVDHQLTRRAAEQLDRPLCYYADYPYAARPGAQAEPLVPGGWQLEISPIPEPALLAWQDSVAQHASQISTFWADDAAMRLALAQYMHRYGGIRIWKQD